MLFRKNKCSCGVGPAWGGVKRCTEQNNVLWWVYRYRQPHPKAQNWTGPHCTWIIAARGGEKESRECYCSRGWSLGLP